MNDKHFLSLKALLHCEMFRATCLAMFWRDCGETSCTNHFTVYTVTAPLRQQKFSAFRQAINTDLKHRYAQLDRE